MPAAYAADEAPDALIKRLSVDVLDSVKSDKAIRAGDMTKVIALVDERIMPNVNFQRMTAAAVGPAWRQATPEQKKQLQDEFKILLVRTYAGALGQVSDQTIAMKPSRFSPEDKEVVVRSEIKGGGDATGAALTTPQYFAAFGNAPYTGFEGAKATADTSTRRYWMIWNLTGADAGKFGFYSGTANNGNKLTSDERLRSAASGGAVTTLTGSSITWNSAPWTSAYLTDAHPVGSLVFECNAKGVPFVYSWLLGSDALICGYGSTDQGVAMAHPTKEIQDHGRMVAYGIESVWGSKAVPRTDGMVNGYVGIVSAFKLPGMPDVA